MWVWSVWKHPHVLYSGCKIWFRPTFTHSLNQIYLSTLFSSSKIPFFIPPSALFSVLLWHPSSSKHSIQKNRLTGKQSSKRLSSQQNHIVHTHAKTTAYCRTLACLAWPGNYSDNPQSVAIEASCLWATDQQVLGYRLQPKDGAEQDTWFKRNFNLTVNF